jgi:hypothetical protein
MHKRIWTPAGKFFSIAANSSSSYATFDRTFVLSNWTNGTWPNFPLNRSLGVSKKADVPLRFVLSMSSEIPQIAENGN